MNYFYELYAIFDKWGWQQLNILWINIWYDKFLHILMIILFWLIIQFILKLLNITSFTINFVILLFISVWKELVDLYIRNKFFSVADLSADFIWILIVYIIILYVFKNK